MKTFGFGNRKSEANTPATASPKKNGDPAKAAVVMASLEFLPAEKYRIFVRDRVMSAAAAVYIERAVNVSMDLEDDADLGKDAKAQKKETQLALHDRYKQRMRLLMGESLLQTISACLVVDPSASNPDEESSTKNVIGISDAFGCVALMLCNYILLTAKHNQESKGGADPSSSSSQATTGYDARIRNVLRMACVELLAERYEADDVDGRLLARLEQRRAQLQLPAPSVELLEPSPSEGDQEATSLEDKETLDTAIGQPPEQLSDMLDTESQKKTSDGSADVSDGPDDANTSKPTEVYDNLYRQYATKKFQALEHATANRILKHVLQNQSKDTSATTHGKESSTKSKPSEEEDDEDGKNGRFSRKNLFRAAKIGGVGVVAGTLFAVTGGLAAPGIAAAIAALGVGGTAVALATSQVALITMFGVGGGGLTAYKMKRRTDGLSEFIFHREGGDDEETNTNDNSTTSIQKGRAGGKRDPIANIEKNATAYLHTTVCISGWLKDVQDFQRPWGVTPTNLERLEKLQRFFSVVEPSKFMDAKELLKPYNGIDAEKDEELWQAFTAALTVQYGKSPDKLLPLKDRAIGLLSDREESILGDVFQAIVEPDKGPSKSTIKKEKPTRSNTETSLTSMVGLQEESISIPPAEKNDDENTFLRVWDYQTEFGGEMYTIQWETEILLRMCAVVNTMAQKLATKATTEILKTTVLATLMAAVAWPTLLVNLAGMIDGDWALIQIRANLAGVELARSLLQTDEQRPINLIGFSFGGCIVCACLTELARHQAIWEEQQKIGDTNTKGKRWGKRSEKSDDIIEYTREPASIVQHVIIMGTPLFVSRTSFRACRRMVAGRFVNCYSPKDWILCLMFQYKTPNGLRRSMCGTGPIQGVSGIENYDVSDILKAWHANYCRTVPDILDYVGFDQPMPIDRALED